MLSAPLSAALILALRLGYPFVIAARRDDAPVALERVAKHGLVDDALRSSIEVPAIFSNREFAAAGGLMSYGDSITEAFRLAGDYAARILNGEKADNLPVKPVVKGEPHCADHAAWPR